MSSQPQQASSSAVKETALQELQRLLNKQRDVQDEIEETEVEMEAEESAAEEEDVRMTDNRRFRASTYAAWLGSLVALFAGPPSKSGIPRQDLPASASVLGALVAFETGTLCTNGFKSVPCSIPSVLEWSEARGRPIVVDESWKLEDNYGDHVSHFYLETRSLPAAEVCDMYGPMGISVIVRTVLQWRSTEPEAHDWKHIVADLTDALNLLNDKPDDLDLMEPLGDLLEKRHGVRAKRVLKRLQLRADARAYRGEGYARKRASTAPPESSQRRSQRVRQGW